MIKREEIKQKLEEYKGLLEEFKLKSGKINFLSIDTSEKIEEIMLFFKYHIEEIDKDILIDIVSLGYLQDKDFLNIVIKKLGEFKNEKN